MKKQKFWREFRSYLMAIIFVLFLRAFFIQTFHVPSGSMEKTVLIGDFLMVNRFVYGMKIPFTEKYFIRFSYPKRGDIIVFTYPLGRENYVKRCVGLSGDTIEVRDKTLYVNGIAQNEPYVEHSSWTTYPPLDIPSDIYQNLWENRKFATPTYRDVAYRLRDNFGPVVVPKGYVFGMGDNRDNSWDSRFWGPIPLNYISGVPIFVYWSMNANVPLSNILKKIRWGRIGKIIRWRERNGKKTK